MQQTLTLPRQPTASPERVTFRAILLGLITIVVMVFYVTYFGWNLIKNYMPVAALLPLVAWVVINTGLKFVSPRHVLSRTEILTVFWVAWVASSLPATGWAGYIITNISAPVHFMSPENRVEEVVLPFLSRSFFLGPDPVVVGQIYTGLEQGLSIPWGAWFRPLFWWTAGCLSLVMAGFFCSVLFYKQWHEHERLTFPLAVFPMDLLETEEGSRVPDVFRTPVFWVGFTFAAGIVCWNVLGYFQHTLPRLTLFDNWQTKAVPISYHFPNYYLRVQPLIMGLAYLCPLDLLFSFWSYNVLQIVKTGLANMTGFTVGLQGQQASVTEILLLESHGALVALVVWSVWAARRHLRETVRVAFSQMREQDDGSPVTYRTAWLGFLASTVFLAGWCVAAGMAIPAVLVQLALLFICFFGVTKYAATTGFTFLDPAGAKGADIMRFLGGTANLSPGTQTTMWMMDKNAMVGVPIRVTAILAVSHFFRMLGHRLRRHPLIWSAAPIAFVVGCIFSAGTTLERSYSEGGMNGPLSLYLWDWRDLESRVPAIEGTEPTFFDPQKLTVWLSGATEAGLLLYLRARYAWWPLHPAAIAFPTRQYGFSLLLVWLIKTLVLHYGGVGLYRRSLPFWYGIMVGYLLGVGISTTADAIWFRGQEHWVHGW